MTTTSPPAAKRVRDIRLDFFRGVCFFIIFIAHIFVNPWAMWIPARFGLSDAAEMFVFLSGMASAAAFATIFAKRGMFLGTARIVHRIWQVYWAHVSIFFVCAVLMVIVDRYLNAGEDYIRGLMMDPFFDERARAALVGLFTLTYVPPFFDILPMYLVILAMVPWVMFLAGFSKWYAMGAVVVTWFVASFGYLDMPRSPWGNDTWYFNPFSWQLTFFTGFALMRGWLPAPKADIRLIVAASVYLLVCLPISWLPLLHALPVLQDTRDWLKPVIDKTHVGIFRYIHFMAIAYLAYIAAGEGGRNLKGWVVTVTSKVGQQSLGIFLLTLALAFSASALLNIIDRTYFTVPLVNLGGMAIMVGVAYMMAWFKSAPWRQPATEAQASKAAATAEWPATANRVQPAE